MNNTLSFQLQLLKNTSFSVLLVNRKTNEVKNWNIFNRKELTPSEIIEIEKKLKGYNFNNCDIYIKSETGDYHNCVIDDVKKDKLQEVLQFVNATYVLFSSCDNYQVVFNLKKSEYTTEQANFIVKKLNEKFGDKNFSGANHYLRTVSFYNKKPKNNNELTYFLVFKALSDEIFAKNLKELLKEFKSKKTEKVFSDEHFQSFQSLDIKPSELSENEKKKARRIIFTEIENCKKIFQSRLDMSIVDYRIVKKLAKNNFNKNQIVSAFLLFTDFSERHSNSSDYLNRTITKALRELELNS